MKKNKTKLPVWKCGCEASLHLQRDSTRESETWAPPVSGFFWTNWSNPARSRCHPCDPFTGERRPPPRALTWGVSPFLWTPPPHPPPPQCWQRRGRQKWGTWRIWRTRGLEKLPSAETKAALRNQVWQRWEMCFFSAAGRDALAALHSKHAAWRVLVYPTAYYDTLRSFDEICCVFLHHNSFLGDEITQHPNNYTTTSYARHLRPAQYCIYLYLYSNCS